MSSTINDIIRKRKGLYINDDVSLEECWNKEKDEITKDISASIDFINNECDDETFYWLSEIFEDVAQETHNKEFVKAISKRAEKVENEEWKESILQEVDIAKEIVGEFETAND